MLNTQQITALQAEGIDWLGKPLKVDGQWGPRTAWWAGIDALSKPRQRIVQIALGYFSQGVKEDVGRPNRGEWVDRFLKPGGIGTGQPWCAAFSSYVLREAGVDCPVYHLSAYGLIQWGKTEGQTTKDPLPGDRFAFLHDPSVKGFTQGHVGIVTGSDANWVSTVEGNVGDSTAVGKRARDGLTFIRSVDDLPVITLPTGLTNLDGSRTR